MLDRERHLLFSLNVIDAIQDKFGGFDGMDELLTGKDGIKNLRWMLTLLLNEGAQDGEEPLSEAQVGKLIHTGNFAAVKQAMFRAFATGSAGDERDEQEEDNEDGDEKNAGAGGGA